MSCSLFSTTYYYYIFYFTMSLTTSLYCQRFLWSSVMLLLYFNCCLVYQSTWQLFISPAAVLWSVLKMHFHCFFRYLYTKFLLLKAMPCLMIAFFSSCIHNYHLLMLEEKKKDTRTKKQRMRADRLLKKKIENQKKYFCYYNSQSASAAVLSFKFPTTTT